MWMCCQNARIATSKAVEWPYIWTDVVLKLEKLLASFYFAPDFVFFDIQYIFGNFKETL